MEGLLILGKLIGSGLATIGVVGAGIGISLIFAGVVIAVGRVNGDISTIGNGKVGSVNSNRSINRWSGLHKFWIFIGFLEACFRFLWSKVFRKLNKFSLNLKRLNFSRIKMKEFSILNEYKVQYDLSNEGNMDHKEGRSLSRDMNKGERIARVNGNIDVNIKEQKIIKINQVRNRSIRTAGLRGDRGITRSYRRINRRYRYSSSNTIVQLVNDLDIGVVALIFVVSLVSIKVINKNAIEKVQKSDAIFNQERERIRSVFQEKTQEYIKEGQMQNKKGGRELFKDITSQVKEIKESTDATIQLVGDTYKESVTESTIAYQDTIGTSITEIKYIIGILSIISLIMVYRKVILELIKKRK